MSLVDLLQCNDRLNKVFNNYNDYMETREKWVQQTDSKSQSELYNRINSPCQRTTTPRPSSPTMVISFYFRIASRDFPFCYL